MLNYLVNFEQVSESRGIDVKFDPASISKLFYAVFLFKKFSKTLRDNTKLRLSFSDWRKYRTGTQKLQLWNVGKQYSLTELTRYSLQNSCNISTGMLADYLGRLSVI